MRLLTALSVALGVFLMPAATAAAAAVAPVPEDTAPPTMTDAAEAAASMASDPTVVLPLAAPAAKLDWSRRAGSRRYLFIDNFNHLNHFIVDILDEPFAIDHHDGGHGRSRRGHGSTLVDRDDGAYGQRLDHHHVG
ncbi:hypothetical protein IWX90DRAFT_487112 [Phyllosticta citrichinensis]|uniref:Uncharacterized protein n=1 Tax=Phyllosticta citrichinensis TaxID=1130410 RepID=A0ABR1XQ06_9PEZI